MASERNWSTDTTYTAWDLCGDWSWMDAFVCRTNDAKPGRALWSEAQSTSGRRTVTLRRLYVSERGIQERRRYVSWNMPMRLVRWDEADDGEQGGA